MRRTIVAGQIAYPGDGFVSLRALCDKRLSPCRHNVEKLRGLGKDMNIMKPHFNFLKPRLNFMKPWLKIVKGRFHFIKHGFNFPIRPRGAARSRGETVRNCPLF